MITIYCFSGLGADEKIFSNLHLNNFKLNYIPWLTPKAKESLIQYSKRMSETIIEPNPVLLGVSFGGMIAIEIAKQMPVQKLILISSIKSTKELPGWMKVAGKLQLNKILPVRSNKLTEKFDNDQLGISTEEEKILVNSYRKKADPVYLNWAINQVLNWKNNWHSETVFHIHGDRDKMFPIKKIKPTHVITGGTHIMILNKAGEISSLINSIIAG